MSYLKDKFKMFMSMAVKMVATFRYKGILTTQEGNTARHRVAAVNSLYCISTSGSSNSPSTTATTTLNTSLVKVATADLRTSTRYRVAAVANDDYIMFAGGHTSSTYSSSIVDAYDNVLTQQRAPGLTYSVGDAAGANVGEYLLIAGGVQRSSNRNIYRNSVNAYDATLTKSTPTSLSYSREYAAGIKFADKALFIGGNRATAMSLLSTDTYNSSLVRGVGPELSTTVASPKAALVGNNLLVLQGNSEVVSFDSTFTRTVLSRPLSYTNLNQPVSVGANNEFCVMPADSFIMVYDSTLTRTDLTSDIGFLRYAGGASFNGTGLIYPGTISSTASNDIHYYQYN